MDLNYTPEEQTFRAEVRAFVTGQLPADISAKVKGGKRLAKDGVKIPRPPGPMKHGGSVIAFIEDPDGYKIELIEKTN